MKKLSLQFAGLLIVFLGLWLLVAQIPWTNLLHIDRFAQKRQQQISSWTLKSYRSERKEVKNALVVNEVVRIKNRICAANGIDTLGIQIHVFNDRQINAFAVPYQQIFVHTALIENCDNADMLAGVLAHEIAHIRLNHISKRITKELAIGGIIMMTGDNFGVIKNMLQKLSSKHFDREQEAEADRMGVVYLQKAGISPAPLSHFFEKLAKDSDLPDALVWLNTHPNSAERAKTIKAMTGSRNYTPISDSASWQSVQDNL